MTPHEFDFSSPEGVVIAAYALLSGRAREPRDWTRFRSLYAPEARLICASGGGDVEGEVLTMEILDLDAYERTRTLILAATDFYEYEVARRVERLADVAHVWSAYEARHAPAGDVVLRGINSIQLVRRGERWWILSAFWQRIRPDAVAPDALLVRQGT
ncbi:MAG TPA: hypothetical protein VK636_16650 [Gemmatimonadaceae bacterium]|nr:hypothetical protein [Gemmatimonadaceae bacterium]